MLCSLFLKEKAQQRKQDLEDSLQAQQYFADANEAESWMREKEPIAANTDYGKDEDSSEVNFFFQLQNLKHYYYHYFKFYLTFKS